MANVTQNLLNWYAENARILPWRVSLQDAKSGRTPDPYKVWVSEIMLQQTTVKTAIPYFNRFIEKWDSIDKLSLANENDVLAVWAGLGYYARGRNLLKCAKELKIKFGGEIPNDKTNLLSLPGIGEYTASAIRSIAFGEREIVIDANIERVVCRLFKIQKPVKEAKKDIKKFASQLFPKFGSGDFAQALMDFANSVCKPKTPNCSNCPLSSSCLSLKLGVVANIPVNPIKKIALTFSDRQVLHQRIEQRFDIMLEQGLQTEVEQLLASGVDPQTTSMKMIGYRQMVEFIDQKIDYDEMRFKGIVATRQLAKRQLTWLRNQKNLIWWVDNGMQTKEFEPLITLIRGFLV